jgi:hypothetical protein
LVGSVNGNPSGLIILGHNLILGLKVIVINDLNTSGFGMAKEALIVFKEISGKHPDFWDKAFSLDWNCKHVLTDTLEVNDQHHIVGLREAWNEFYSDLGFTILFKSASLIGNVEFILHVGAAVSWDSDDIIYFNI